MRYVPCSSVKGNESSATAKICLHFLFFIDDGRRLRSIYIIAISRTYASTQKLNRTATKKRWLKVCLSTALVTHKCSHQLHDNRLWFHRVLHMAGERTATVEYNAWHVRRYGAWSVFIHRERIAKPCSPTYVAQPQQFAPTPGSTLIKRTERRSHQQQHVENCIWAKWLASFGGCIEGLIWRCEIAYSLGTYIYTFEQ